MRIATDIDDVLWKLVEDQDSRVEGIGAKCACGMNVKQEVDHLMVDFVHSLILDGNDVFVWSAGGVDYAKNWVKRFAPAWESLVEVIPKEKGHDIDVCFDDQDVDLATINLRVKREHADHWLDEK